MNLAVLPSLCSSHSPHSAPLAALTSPFVMPVGRMDVKGGETDDRPNHPATNRHTSVFKECSVGFDSDITTMTILCCAPLCSARYHSIASRWVAPNNLDLG